MANMAHCRFKNTADDLYDCYKHIGDKLENEEEIKARKELIDTCQDIIDEARDCGIIE